MQLDNEVAKTTVSSKCTVKNVVQKDKILIKTRKMIFQRFKILVIFILFCPELFGQHYDFVKILSGQGIVYNNDFST